MRVLVLATDAFGGHGGIAKFNRDLLRALCAHSDFTEVVAIPRSVPSTLGVLPPGLVYVTTGLNGKLSYISSVLKTVRNGLRFDLIVCAHVNLLPVAYLVRLRIDAPILLLIHGIDAWQPTRSRITNFLLRRVDAFAAVSDVTKQRFLRWARVDVRRMFLLPNAVELDGYGPGPKSAKLLDRYGLAGKTVLMTLGRMVSAERHKGFDEVLQLLPILLQTTPDIVYLAVGDGPDRRRLEDKARSLGVNEHVVFTGYIDEAEKADHYRLADVYIMPSRGEGFGIVFLEAMACGVPVVASKVDGGREAVRDHQMGILIDPQDPKEIEDAVRKALSRPSKVVPEGLNYFSYEHFVKRCHHITDQVIYRHKGSGALRDPLLSRNDT